MIGTRPGACDFRLGNSPFTIHDSRLVGPMEPLRRAAVAGSWYPGEASRLAADIERYIAAADVDPVAHLRAVIAPHAGLTYSGPVAAFSYKAARETRFGTIVMVG